jgi:hypothetical protein
MILWTHAAYATPQTNVCEAKHALAQWLAPFRSAGWLESDAIQHKVVEQLHTEAHRSALSIVLTQPTVCGCTITRGLPRDETLMIGRETGLYMNDASHPRIAAVMTTRGSRLALAKVHLARWLAQVDHVIVSDEGTVDVHVGLTWGGPFAHRALAGLMCMHARLSTRRYEWVAVLDDDTVVSLPLLEASLAHSARADHINVEEPHLLGAHIDAVEWPQEPTCARAPFPCIRSGVCRTIRSHLTTRAQSSRHKRLDRGLVTEQTLAH